MKKGPLKFSVQKYFIHSTWQDSFPPFTPIFGPAFVEKKQKVVALPETKKKRLKIVGWNTIVSFWDGNYFQALQASFRERSQPSSPRLLLLKVPFELLKCRGLKSKGNASDGPGVGGPLSVWCVSLRFGLEIFLRGWRYHNHATDIFFSTFWIGWSFGEWDLIVVTSRKNRIWYLRSTLLWERPTLSIKTHSHLSKQKSRRVTSQFNFRLPSISYAGTGILPAPLVFCAGNV